MQLNVVNLNINRVASDYYFKRLIFVSQNNEIRYHYSIVDLKFGSYVEEIKCTTKLYSHGFGEGVVRSDVRNVMDRRGYLTPDY